jgi:segregation and condensation protein B
VKPELAEVVRPLAPGQEVPEPVLRTLALIAYRGPILQSEVVRLRGQRAYAHIRQLVERGWVRAEEEGPTKRLSVTKALLAYFRVQNPEELRALISPGEPPGG